MRDRGAVVMEDMLRFDVGVSILEVFGGICLVLWRL